MERIAAPQRRRSRTAPKLIAPVRDEAAPAPAPSSPAIERPRISATRGKNEAQIFDFEEIKRKKLSASESSNKPIVATRGRKRKSAADSIRVETLKPSKNTWLFRLRWTEETGDRPHYDVSRVSDQVFQMIKSDRRNYVEFKKQLIEEFKQGAFRSRHETRTSPDSLLRNSHIGQ